MIISCVWVDANVHYSAEYVVRLRDMVRRHLHQPHHFVCLTDKPFDPFLRVQGVSCKEVPRLADVPGWWSKLEIFNPDHNLAGPGVNIDLDVIVVDELSPVVNYPATLAMIPDAGTFQPRNGLSVFKRFNSSVIKLCYGQPARVYSTWTPSVAKRLWGDQDWLGEQLGDAVRTMPLEWFPRLSELEPDLGPGCVPPAAKMILCKKPKNMEAAERWPWIRGQWW